MTAEKPISEKTCETVTQDALNQTEFGWFNLKIFALCGLLSINGCIGIGNVGLILPSVACDFEMSTVDKGRLGMMPILGMVFGPYFWAMLVEMRGRRVGLIACLICHGIGDLVASIVSSFSGLMIAKFVVGFGFSGLISLTFPFLGEFQPCKYRDRLLAWLELPWACGLLTVAGLGWAILPLNFSYYSVSTGFFFKSWSLYLLVCSLLSPLLAVWIFFLPETPKYLAETGQHAKLLELLADIYHANTKCPREEYLEKIKKMSDPGINDMIARAQERYVYKRKTVRQMIRQYYEQTKEIIRPPYLKTTLLIAICSYATTAPYFTLILWLPEIFQRYAHFDALYPGERASICTVSDALYSDNATANNQEVISCTTLDTSVYIHNMVLGATCVPVAFWLPLFVDKLGYKPHLVVASLASAGLAFGLFFVESSTQNLVVACLFEALASVSITIVLCVIVELYPTHLRVIASAFAAFVGRFGALFGISAVGLLIDNHCKTLIIIIGTHLIIAGVTGIFLPIRKSKEEYEKREKLKLEHRN